MSHHEHIPVPLNTSYLSPFGMKWGKPVRKLRCFPLKRSSLYIWDVCETKIFAALHFCSMPWKNCRSSFVPSEVIINLRGSFELLQPWVVFPVAHLLVGSTIDQETMKIVWPWHRLTIRIARHLKLVLVVQEARNPLPHLTGLHFQGQSPGSKI